MSQTQPVVAIVDDDEFIQRALTRLLYTEGWHAVTFSSAEAFLQTSMQALPDCLVLDVWLPGMTGQGASGPNSMLGRQLDGSIPTSTTWRNG